MNLFPMPYQIEVRTDGRTNRLASLWLAIWMCAYLFSHGIVITPLVRLFKLVVAFCHAVVGWVIVSTGGIAAALRFGTMQSNHKTLDEFREELLRRGVAQFVKGD